MLSTKHINAFISEDSNWNTHNAVLGTYGVIRYGHAFVSLHNKRQRPQWTWNPLYGTHPAKQSTYGQRMAPVLCFQCQLMYSLSVSWCGHHIFCLHTETPTPDYLCVRLLHTTVWVLRVALYAGHGTSVGVTGKGDAEQAGCAHSSASMLGANNTHKCVIQTFITAL